MKRSSRAASLVHAGRPLDPVSERDDTAGTQQPRRLRYEGLLVRDIAPGILAPDEIGALHADRSRRHRRRGRRSGRRVPPPGRSRGPARRPARWRPRRSSFDRAEPKQRPHPGPVQQHRSTPTMPAPIPRARRARASICSPPTWSCSPMISSEMSPFATPYSACTSASPMSVTRCTFASFLLELPVYRSGGRIPGGSPALRYPAGASAVGSPAARQAAKPPMTSPPRQSQAPPASRQRGSRSSHGRRAGQFVGRDRRRRDCARDCRGRGATRAQCAGYGVSRERSRRASGRGRSECRSAARPVRLH